MNKNDLANIRKTHSLGRLLEEEIGEDPFELFHSWLKLAVEKNLPEPNALTLATCSRDGRPSARMMLLKELDASGFVFYTNYESRKGRDLQENPMAAILFYWYDLEKQVRIEGKIEKLTREETIKYFHIRPRESQIGAHASKQSSIIPDRKFLDASYEKLEKKYENAEIPVPDYWGGFRLIPDIMEFWQGRPSRLHDRIRFRKENGKWIKERLSP